jgi:hypothetical protein
VALKIEQAALKVLGGAEGLNASIATYQAALVEFAATTDVPPPTAHPVVVAIVTRYAGLYEVIEDTPPVEPEPLPLLPSNYPLTDRQLRLGLIRHGIPLATVQSAIDTIPDQLQRDEAQVWWEFSKTINWDHPMTQSLMALVGVTSEQATAMWMVAKDYAA